MANEAASNASNPTEGLRETWEEEVQAARELLEFALAAGREAKRGWELSDTVLTALHAAGHTLYKGKSPSQSNGWLLSVPTVNWRFSLPR